MVRPLRSTGCRKGWVVSLVCLAAVVDARMCRRMSLHPRSWLDGGVELRVGGDEEDASDGVKAPTLFSEGPVTMGANRFRIDFDTIDS